MPASTPVYGFPYPLGTDRVMDGDNAIEALARAVESQIAAAAYKVLGYAQVVADQTGIGTTPVALAGLSLPVQVAANRRIRVSAFGEFTASTSGNTVRMRTLIDGANAQLAAVTIQSGAQVQSVQSAVVVTPDERRSRPQPWIAPSQTPIRVVGFAHHVPDLAGSPPPNQDREHLT